MSKVLVTGANGFIGTALSKYLAGYGHQVSAAVRGEPAEKLKTVGISYVPVGNIDVNTDWSGALANVNAVVHLAGRAHVLKESSHDPMAAFRAVNTEGSLNLARQAAAAGVRRFVFISSVGVNGNQTDAAAFTEADTPNPHDRYAISKLEAELGLQAIAAHGELEVVILRPPLVYGAGAPGNFRRLIDLVAAGYPLPFGRVDNRRSLLYLGNLVDAIRLCVEHPAAAGQTFLVDDGSPVSTPELIRAVAHAMGRPARLLAVPVGVLAFVGALLGKRAEVARLTGSLWVDGSLIRSRLGWTPPFTLRQGLAATVGARRQTAC